MTQQFTQHRTKNGDPEKSGMYCTDMGLIYFDGNVWRNAEKEPPLRYAPDYYFVSVLPETDEAVKTEAVKNCKTFAELEEVIRKHAPFISNSRETPEEWHSYKLLRRIFIVIDGGAPTNVTRANGLREKVIELCAKIGML